ncbi:MAG: BsuPI-related putative proteinase inhibitor [Armatimonadota bacterium]
MRNWISAVFMILLLTISYNTAFSQSQTTPRISTGYTQIRATITRVERLGFPNARLTMRVTQSSNTRILNLRGRAASVQARNFIYTSRGRANCSDPRNIESIAAYYLLQGDEISAKLYTGYVRGSAWYVHDIRRLTRGIPLIGGGIPVSEGLQIRLRTGQSSYNAGSSVNMTLTVTNTGDTARTLRFPTGQRYDFIVTQDGQEVWRWSAGRFFTQALAQQRLDPDESLEFTDVWRQVDNRRQRVSPGEYEITGVLMTTDPNRPTTGPIRITIR